MKFKYFLPFFGVNFAFADVSNNLTAGNIAKFSICLLAYTAFFVGVRMLNRPKTRGKSGKNASKARNSGKNLGGVERNFPNSAQNQVPENSENKDK